MANKNDKKAHEKNAPVETELDEAALLAQAQAEFDSAEGETVVGSGFPPYLKPQVGTLYKFRPVMTDARNPKFVRHTVIHLGKTAIVCQTGPVDDAEVVEVQPGELYSISDYKGIPFDDLMGLEVLAICKERRKMAPLPDGQTRAPMFIFDFKLSAADKLVFEDRKKARMTAEATAARLGAAAAHTAHVNGLPVTPSAVAPRQGQLAGTAG